MHIEINSANTVTKKTHIKVFNNVPKQIESIDNTYYYYDKHKKLFNNVLKQIIEVNKVHTQTNNAFIDLNKCKEEHKKLFINVLNELKSNNNVNIQKNAGHKDSSANIINEVHTHDINEVPIQKTVNINNMHTNDIKEVPMQKNAEDNDSYVNIINEVHIRDINNDVLLHNHILYHANKINNMHKCISNNQKYIAYTFSNIYHDGIDTQFNKLKEVNVKLNSLLNSTYKTIFNKKVAKEQIILDTKNSINIRKYTPIFDNKRVCILEIDEYLSNNIDNLRNNIKNKKYNEVLTMLLLIRKHIIKSINRMRTHTKIKKDNNANKKVPSTNNVNITNKKVTNTNNVNKKVSDTNNANKKVTNTNNANKKVPDTNNTNKKVINANNANKKTS